MNIRKIIADRPWILAVLVTAGVALWVASGYIGRDPMPVPVPVAAHEDGPALRVQVRTQVAQQITRYISIFGRSAPTRSVELKAETDGRVTRIAGARGQQLKAGDLILSLDLRDRQARLEQARAGVNQHQTAYEAQLRLKSDGYVSDTQIAETLAKLEAARAELSRAELDLGYMQVRAPFDGVIQDRQVELGDFVREGDAIVSFVDNTRLIVTGSIAEQDARFVQIGVPAAAELVTGQTASGRIRFLAPVADESTRTFTVELEIPNADGSLPAGVTAQMRIPAGEMLAQKVAPSLLTLDTDGKIGIKIVDEYNRVVFYPVDIAQSDSDGVWVAGLPETTNVIVLGQGYVDIGETVDPVFTGAETALAAEKLP